MSIETIAFVLGVDMGKGSAARKLALIGYANHADKFGHHAFPSTETIAEYVGCDERTVRRHVGWLIENGYMREGDQRYVAHRDPRYRPIVYDLAMSEQKIKEWAASPARDGVRAKAIENGRKPKTEFRGDNLSPLNEQVTDDPGGTESASRGDMGVPLTVIEPSTVVTAVNQTTSSSAHSCAAASDDAQGVLAVIENPRGLPPDVYKRWKSFDSKRGQENPVEWCAAIDDTKLWQEHCQRQGIPIVNPGGAVQSMRIMLFDLLRAGYQRQEIRDALAKIGEPWPAKKALERALLESRGIRNGNGHRPSTTDQRIAAGMAVVQMYADRGE